MPTRKAMRKRRKRASTIPKATISLEPRRFDLKTLPEGYVELRRMSYGELMTSQDLAYQVQMRANEADASSPEVGLTVTRMAITEYQFRTCIVSHNLEDQTSRALDFSRAMDVHMLDSNVGQEISDIIDREHNWKQKYPNSQTPSESGSSSDGVSATQGRMEMELSEISPSSL